MQNLPNKKQKKKKKKSDVKLIIKYELGGKNIDYIC